MFNSYYSASSALGVMSVLAIISVIIAVAGGILLYFLFLSPKSQGKFTGFLGWMYDFLSFKKLVLNTVLNVLYLILACFITLMGFFTLFVSFGSGLMLLVMGNILLRLSYEIILAFLIMCQNTSEINHSLKRLLPPEEPHPGSGFPVPPQPGNDFPGPGQNPGHDFQGSPVQNQNPDFQAPPMQDPGFPYPPMQNQGPEFPSPEAAAPAPDPICRQCGAPYVPGENFCGKCGAKLN